MHHQRRHVVHALLAVNVQQVVRHQSLASRGSTQLPIAHHVLHVLLGTNVQRLPSSSLARTAFIQAQGQHHVRSVHLVIIVRLRVHHL